MKLSTWEWYNLADSSVINSWISRRHVAMQQTTQQAQSHVTECIVHSNCGRIRIQVPIWDTI